MNQRFNFENTAVLLILIIFCCSYISQAAPGDSLKPRYGIYVHYLNSMDDVSFYKLPGVVNCCPQYESVSGSGMAFGILYEYPLGRNFLIGGRLGYGSKETEITKDEMRWISVIEAGTSSEYFATIHHELIVNRGWLEFIPYAVYRPYLDIDIHLGPYLKFALDQEFSQVEKITDPPGRKFKNGKSERMIFDGPIPEAEDIGFGIEFGLSYEFALGKRKEYIIAPEIIYDYALSPVIADSNWYDHCLRIGLALRYSPKPGNEAPAEEPVAKQAPQPDMPEPPKPETSQAEPVKEALKLALEVSKIDGNGNMEAIDQLTCEEYTTKQLYPILPYVFFPENSDEMPRKYNQMSGNQALNYDESEIHTASGQMEVYYDILNIVGSRMKQNPGAVLKLTGCNCDQGPEKKNRALSNSRAEAVKDYLVDVWDIPESRLITEIRDLPKRHSKGNTPECNAENRRVELFSEDPAILAPVFNKGTIACPDFESLAFEHNYQKKNAENYEFKLFAFRPGDQKLIYENTGQGQLAETFSIASFKLRELGKVSQLRYSLKVQEPGTSNILETGGELPVSHIAMQDKEQSKSGIQSYNEYRLILFEDNSSKLSKRHRTVTAKICEDVTPGSTIIISGYSDEDKGLALSESITRNMASMIATALPCHGASVSVNGLGALNLFDEELPEGRFYNRGAIVRVRTPFTK